MKNFIFLRSLRHAEHTVFCVQDGQKSYYDQQFGVRCAYSSGQQVKRSILDAILESLGEAQAPITFNYEITKDNGLSNKEPWSPCDPTFTDQLLGGWMKAQTGETSLKRRSPFSISALRPLHPLLGGLENQKENLTFDRSNNPNIHPVIVKDSTGAILTEDQIIKFLTENKRTLSRRNWIPENTRATGLFISRSQQTQSPPSFLPDKALRPMGPPPLNVHRRGCRWQFPPCCMLRRTSCFQ